VADQTPIQRAADAIYRSDEFATNDPAGSRIGRSKNQARAALSAALDVEEMARVVAEHQLVVGPHGLTRRCSCGADVGTVDLLPRHQTAALRDAILGEA